MYGHVLGASRMNSAKDSPRPPSPSSWPPTPPHIADSYAGLRVLLELRRSRRGDSSAACGAMMLSSRSAMDAASPGSCSSRIQPASTAKQTTSAAEPKLTTPSSASGSRCVHISLVSPQKRASSRSGPVKWWPR